MQLFYPLQVSETLIHLEQIVAIKTSLRALHDASTFPSGVKYCQQRKKANLDAKMEQTTEVKTRLIQLN